MMKGCERVACVMNEACCSVRHVNLVFFQETCDFCEIHMTMQEKSTIQSRLLGNNITVFAEYAQKNFSSVQPTRTILV